MLITTGDDNVQLSILHCLIFGNTGTLITRSTRPIVVTRHGTRGVYSIALLTNVNHVIDLVYRA